MALRKWTASRRTLFLDELRRTANISAAARAAGVSRKTAYWQRQNDPALREDWDHALEEALDDLEAELRRRAITGVEKPVYYGGKPCGSVTSYSDALGMFLLRSRRPQIFTDGALNADEGEREVASARDRLARLLGESPPSSDRDDDARPTD